MYLRKGSIVIPVDFVIKGNETRLRFVAPCVEKIVDTDNSPLIGNEKYIARVSVFIKFRW